MRVFPLQEPNTLPKHVFKPPNFPDYALVLRSLEPDLSLPLYRPLIFLELWEDFPLARAHPCFLSHILA